jgi:hypothetical protein
MAGLGLDLGFRHPGAGGGGGKAAAQAMAGVLGQEFLEFIRSKPIPLGPACCGPYAGAAIGFATGEA